MATRSRRVLVLADTLTRLDTEEETDKTTGSALTVTNRSEVTCELGGDDLVVGEGYELGAGESIPLSVTRTDKGVYAISGSELTLQILEVGV